MIFIKLKKKMIVIYIIPHTDSEQTDKLKEKFIKKQTHSTVILFQLFTFVIKQIILKYEFFFLFF